MLGIRARLRHGVVAPLLFVLVAACSVSQARMDAMVPDDEDAFARAHIQALPSGNTRMLEDALDPSLRGPEVMAELAKMVKLVAGRRIEALKVIGYQGMSFNGAQRRNITYQLDLSDGWAVANVASRTEDRRRIIDGISVTQIPEPLERTHAFRLGGKSATHYIFLGLVALIPLLMLYAVVLVFRMRPRRRWLWVLACIWGVGQWSLNWTTGDTGTLPVNIQLLGSAAIRASMYSPWILSLSLPIGALYVIW
ncbi:MAG TPA: hypothetical protein VF625_04710, partial [Longimicrobium sp.]